VKQYAALGVQPGKLVLGVPWYGYSVPCASSDRARPCELPVPWPADPIGPWPCKGQPDPWCCPQQVSYAKILERKEEASSGTWQFDSGSVTAFFDASNSSGGRVQLWYDDPATLSVKARWMKAAGVRGVAMWTASSLNYTASAGKQAAEMWAALRLAL
jgi:di-N-acetylchitobiase